MNQFGYRTELAAAHKTEVIRRLQAAGKPAALHLAAPHLVRSVPTKTVVLHDAAKAVLGDYLQPQNQPRGTCISRGAKRIVDLTQCVRIGAGDGLKFAYSSHAVIYGAAREHVGMLGGDPNDANDDGCTGSAAAWAVNNAGNLRNVDVKDDDNDDKLACLWGARGVPAEVKEAADDHLIKGIANAVTFDQVKIAIGNGYGVTVASDVGFEGNGFQRDRDGVCRRGGQWPHQMCFTGYSPNLSGRGEALLVDQSWGPDQPGGPLGPIPIPSYSFWVLRPDAEAMISQGDTWVYSGFDGWPADQLHWLI